MQNNQYSSQSNKIIDLIKDIALGKNVKHLQNNYASSFSLVGDFEVEEDTSKVNNNWFLRDRVRNVEKIIDEYSSELEDLNDEDALRLKSVYEDLSSRVNRRNERSNTYVDESSISSKFTTLFKTRNEKERPVQDDDYSGIVVHDFPANSGYTPSKTDLDTTVFESDGEYESRLDDDSTNSQDSKQAIPCTSLLDNGQGYSFFNEGLDDFNNTPLDDVVSETNEGSNVVYLDYVITDDLSSPRDLVPRGFLANAGYRAAQISMFLGAFAVSMGPSLANSGFNFFDNEPTVDIEGCVNAYYDTLEAECEEDNGENPFCDPEQGVEHFPGSFSNLADLAASLIRQNKGTINNDDLTNLFCGRRTTEGYEDLKKDLCDEDEDKDEVDDVFSSILPKDF